MAPSGKYWFHKLKVFDRFEILRREHINHAELNDDNQVSR